MIKKCSLVLVALLTFSNIFATTPIAEKSKVLSEYIQSSYSLISFKGEKPGYDLFKKGMVGFLNLKKQHKLSDDNILTLIDFRLSSNKKRMWVIDLSEHKVLYHSLVAHGRNTGNEFAKKFSNVPNSNTSSLGFYVTGETYSGKHGLSLRLDGVEKGFNDNARERAIVVHGADYVNPSFTNIYGRIGRSFGCPSIPMKGHEEVINKLANRTCMFIFYPEKEYLQNSSLINEEGAYDVLLSSNLI